MGKMIQNDVFLDVISRNEIRVGDIFSVSIDENQVSKVTKNKYILKKDGLIYTIKDDCGVFDEELDNILHEGSKLIKEQYLKHQELLYMLHEANDGLIDDSSLTGVEFEKSSLKYKILEYSSTDKTGILLRYTDNKLLLIINFPKYGKVLWNEKGEFNADAAGLKQCIEKYNQKNIKVSHQCM